MEATTTVAKRKTITVLVRDLRAGDRLTDSSGAVLTVTGVDAFGACAIVEFDDGTATAPILCMIQCIVEREDAQ